MGHKYKEKLDFKMNKKTIIRAKDLQNQKLLKEILPTKPITLK